MLADQKQLALDSVKQLTQGEQVLEREAKAEFYQEEGSTFLVHGAYQVHKFKPRFDLEKILKLINVYKKTGFKVSRVNPWHSDTFLQEKSEWNFFKEEIYRVFKLFGKDDVILDNLWSTYQAKGEYTGIHNHTLGGIGNNKRIPDWTFCYYPQDIVETGGLIFHLDKEPSACVTEYPEAGDLYIFRSNIWHSTQPYFGNDFRFCISGNLRERYGTYKG